MKHRLSFNRRILGLLILPCLVSGVAQAFDVQFYVIQKSAKYAQTGTGTPALSGSTPYRFEADVLVASGGMVTGATVQTPSGAVETLAGDPSTGDFQFKQTFSSTAALNSAFPAGNYVYRLNTVHDGAVTSTLALTADNYPAAPHISNYAAAQTVNAAANFTLSWDAFAGGTANDLILVEVDDAVTGQTVFMTPLPGSPGSLNGTATSAIIPAGTLTANHTYQVRVEFDRIVALNTNAYPGATGVALFGARTAASLVTAGSTTGGPDVRLYVVAKGQQFFQVDTNSPAPRVDAPFVFNAFVDAQATGDVANASVQLPNGTSNALAAHDNGQSFEFLNGFATKSALDNAYPAGTYTFSINTTHSGLVKPALTLPGDNYPSVPHISNWTAAQGIDPASNFTLAWDPFQSGTTNDIVQLTVSDSKGNTVFETPPPTTAGALNGTATSVTIPQGALSLGQTYLGELLFARGTLNTSSYPGVPGLAGYFTLTDFNLITKNPASPSLSNPSLLPTGVFQLQLTGSPNADYAIAVSDDLSHWTLLTTIHTDANGMSPFADNPATNSSHRFYRANASVP